MFVYFLDIKNTIMITVFIYYSSYLKIYVNIVSILIG